MSQAAGFASSLERSRLKGSESSAFGHQTLPDIIPQDKLYENVAIDGIDGERQSS